MEKWVKDFVENFYSKHLPKDCLQGEIPVGTIVQYKGTHVNRNGNYIDIENEKGYPVKITNSHYWGTHGLSNFFYWINLITGEEECGYGFFETF